MEGPFSPIVKKIAGEVVVGKGKRTFQAPTEVNLEDWWLSKPDGEEGISVSGRPVEMRRYDNARREYDSAPTKKRYPSREFRSTQVVKRHSCTTVETSDGLFVYLYGFINRSRTRQNGFSSEVCRDFIYGFPFNWEDYAANSVAEESSQSNHDHFSQSFLPAALDAYNGAQLHDMVLSLTDDERGILNKQMYDNLTGMFNIETANGKSIEPPSNANPSSSFAEEEILQTPNSTVAKVMNKRQLKTSPQNYNEQEEVDSPTSRKRVCRTLKNPKNPAIEESVNVSPQAFVKRGPEEKPDENIQTSRKRACTSVTKLNNSGIERNADVSPNGSVKKEVVDESTRVVRTLRERSCKSATKLKKAQTAENVNASPKAKGSEEQRNLRPGERKVPMKKVNMEENQSKVRQMVKRLTSIGKSSRLLKELLY